MKLTFRVTWYQQDRKYKDSLEVVREKKPTKWAKVRCLEGETYTIEKRDTKSGIWLVI